MKVGTTADAVTNTMEAIARNEERRRWRCWAQRLRRVFGTTARDGGGGVGVEAAAAAHVGSSECARLRSVPRLQWWLSIGAWRREKRQRCYVGSCAAVAVESS